MQSILPWVGGKNSCTDKIVAMMPEHYCYTEIFAGGLWIYFAKPVSKVEVVNDLNGELVNFYRVLQRKHEEFVLRSKHELYARELYYEYYGDYMSGEHFKLSDVERAFRFFALIREAYSAKFGGGWSYGATRNKPKSFFDVFRDGSVERVSERLQNTYIDNRDFEDVIKGYDNEKTLFLADPPYVLANVDDYYFRSMGVGFKAGVNQGFSLYDQQRLYKLLSGMKGKCILTIDDCAWVRERYCDGQEELGEGRKFWWIDNEIYYTSSDMENRRTAKELIICNYNILEQIERNKKFGKRDGESLSDY